MREDLLEVHIETSWVCHHSDDLLTSNEPTPSYRRPAPPYLLTWSDKRWHHRFRGDVPDTVRRSLSGLVEDHWPFEDPRTPIPFAKSRALLGVDHGLTRTIAGPAYYIPEIRTPSTLPVAITSENVHVCAETFPSMVKDVQDERPCFAVIVEGKAVSICTTVRRSPHAAEAGLDTLESHRKNGYGTAVTSAWASRHREEGLIPFYSTSWDNSASRRVAEKLGCIQYASDFRLE